MKLLNCPFCGSTAHYMEIRGSPGYTYDKLKIQCTICFCSTDFLPTQSWESGKGTFDILEQIKLELADLWNKRTLLDDK